MTLALALAATPVFATGPAYCPVPGARLADDSASARASGESREGAGTHAGDSRLSPPLQENGGGVSYEAQWLERSRRALEEGARRPPPDWLRMQPDAQSLEAARAIAEAARGDMAQAQAKTLPAGTVYIFASFSLPEATLRALLDEAMERHVILVLRGVPEGGNFLGVIRRLRALMSDPQHPPNVIINPVLFQRFQVSVVPTLALVRADQTELAVRGPVRVDWLRRQAAMKTAQGKRDLGRRGETYPIAEVDLVVEMQRRMAKIDWEQKREQAIARFWRHTTFIELPPAREDREYEVDMTVEVTEDIRDADGGLLIAAGERFNPLDSVSLTKTILIFNGRDARQVRRVDEIARDARARGRGVILITTGVDREDGWRWLDNMETTLQGPVYLLQSDLVERFKLQHVPSVISANGNRLQVRELALGG